MTDWVAYRAKHRKTINHNACLSSKRRRKRNQFYVDSIKRSRGCKYCTEHDPSCLDFHHKNHKSEELWKLASSGNSLKTKTT